MLHDLLVFTLRVYVNADIIPAVVSIEPFANLLALHLFINLILIVILMPEKCNVTEVYSFSIKVRVVASYRW